MCPEPSGRELDPDRLDPASLDSAPARVLVVDDEPTVADVCREFLSGERFELTVAPSGEEAVRLIPEVRPDAILTDINLPGISGLEVMRYAKTLDPETCVIVVTGHASTSTAIDALRQGAYDYVTKPFDLESVLKIVKGGIAHRRLKVQNRELIEELRKKHEILRHHEHELRERVRIATLQMTSLYEVGKEISASLELESRLALICRKTAEMTGGRAAVVYLRRESSEGFRAAAVHGAPRSDHPTDAAHFISGEGPFGIGVIEQSAVRLIAADGAPRLPVPGLDSPGVGAILGIPMVAETQVIGMLVALDKTGGFGPDDENFLALFASQAAIAVRNAQLFEHTKSLDRLKSEFVAVVSHEIRTPLTSIKGAIELLSDERYFRNADQQVKLLTIAHANSERLMSLISDILDFSKLDSASLPMSIERQRLEPVVVQVTQNLRMLIEQRRIQLEVIIAPDLPDVMIDPNRVAQVITNLLSNAIKFSSTEGRIEVTAETWQGLVRVGVRDHGEGIAAANLPRLFQKFSQIDSTSTRKAGGTGLGLVICKAIIEQHAGQISVESTLGEGSTFYFVLPAAPATASASPETSSARRT